MVCVVPVKLLRQDCLHCLRYVKDYLIFKIDPKQNLVPCYRCSSCMAYIENNHPDIIELDAASHTEVETIRSIIDNAYMLPILGKKKFILLMKFIC